MSDLSLIVNILKAASFLNLLLFLHQGKYPTLTQRFLNLSQESTRKRNIEYTYMTRELLWHGFSVGILLFSSLFYNTYINSLNNRRYSMYNLLIHLFYNCSFNK